MNASDYLHYLVDEIHTSIMATVDDEGLPVTAAIDIMDTDGQHLYFLTARGKNLYDRLVKRKALALTAMKGEDTMSSVALSIRGKVREIGPDTLSDLFEKNPYMKDIYPSQASRAALTVFEIYEGTGEWFDLSKRPIERDSFVFGSAPAKTGSEGYEISEDCIGCGKCQGVCPQDCIRSEAWQCVIEQSHCLHCGMCMEVCPVGAVKRK